MKAIIPVAGMGMRLRPHTYTQPKALIPVAGKPILSFIIDRLRVAGIEEFVFVIGYLGEKIEAYVSKYYPDIKSYFVVQHSREGLGHAIWLAKKVVDKNEPIFIALGDLIFEADIESVLNSTTSTLGIKKVADPREFGVAELNEDGSISKVIEKPEIPKSNNALVGLYKINESEALFEALNSNILIKYKTRGEYHLTDGIMRMIGSGIKFNSFPVENWYDCGKRDVLLETNATILKQEGFQVADPENYENTILVQPVAIAPGVKISNSIIGPNVAIGEKTKISGSIIRDSIIGNYSRLGNVVLHDSVIGSDTSIKGLRHSLNIGDNTEIDLS